MFAEHAGAKPVEATYTAEADEQRERVEKACRYSSPLAASRIAVSSVKVTVDWTGWRIAALSI
jgi:hypothetical protein